MILLGVCFLRRCSNADVLMIQPAGGAAESQAPFLRKLYVLWLVLCMHVDLECSGSYVLKALH